MHRSLFLLTIAALTGFATAVHADDGAAPRSTMALRHAGPASSRVADLARRPHGQTIGRMIVAKLDGQGFIGTTCHATYRGKIIYQGIYDRDNAELVCRDPGGDEIPCHVYDTLGPPLEPLCQDGWQ
jgi:hypothetical protein